MEQLQISFYDIESAIQAENITMGGGDILTDESRRSLRVSAKFTDIDQIGRVIVKHEDQRAVFLEEIAEISFAPIEPNSYARLDSLPVISLDVVKKSGKNLLNATDTIKGIINYAKKNVFHEAVEVKITNDQSIFTRTMVDSLENSIISGMILVVLVLLFFLGLRNAAFVGMAIPLSMLMGIMVLNFMAST